MHAVSGNNKCSKSTHKPSYALRSVVGGLTVMMLKVIQVAR